MNPAEWVKQILLESSRLGARLFRRNVGMGWTSTRCDHITVAGMAPVKVGDVIVRQARPLHSGIKGQYDCDGWISVTITPDMVGKTFARHVEIEGKQGTGRETPEQRAWGDAVRAAGGLAGVARDLGDIARILGTD